MTVVIPMPVVNLGDIRIWAQDRVSRQRPPASITRVTPWQVVICHAERHVPSVGSHRPDANGSAAGDRVRAPAPRPVRDR